MYALNSVLLVLLLFLGIFLVNELSFRLGRVIQARTTDEVKSLTGALQASILGLLALLLGFTFNMSMQRFDNRSVALIEEANAIGTVMLRSQLLPVEHQAETQTLLREYVQLRIAVSSIDLTQVALRQEQEKLIQQQQSLLWAMAIRAAETDPRAITTGAFITALTNMIDSQGKRNALLQRQVPEPVLLLLFLVFLASGGIIGYSAGLNGERMLMPTVLVSVLICLIVFLVIDLDRPKRGVIQVDQTPLTSLATQL